MHALILVDLQYDFLPGGALAVPEGNAVIPIANALMPRFPLVVATQDWHPADHQSFASQHAGRKIGDVIDLDGLQQILWPDHCVQGTRGAQLVEQLNQAAIARVIQKGTNPLIDSYSGFFDNGHRQATELEEYLNRQDVSTVFIMGLATDYCVKFSALDAVELGFETYLIREGCRAVNLKAVDEATAIKQMLAAGVQLADHQSLMTSPLIRSSNQ
jgi:nicotinamidase/pyrazinamidase